MTVETLDARALLAADMGMGASMLAMDVNADGAVTAADALDVVNDLGRNRSRDINSASGAGIRDTNRDGTVSSLDALTVINHMNRHGANTIDLRELIGQRGDLISDAQKENLGQLFADLNAIRAESDVTPEQITQLLNDLAVVIDSATRPSEESVSQLVENTRDSVEDGQFTPAELARLTSDVQAVLESANISQDDAQVVVNDIRAIVESSNVDQEDIQVIVQDLQAIFLEFQNREPLVSETQRENVTTLRGDLSAIRADSEVTPEQIQQMRTDLRSVAEGATRPDPWLVIQLIRQSRAAVADGEITQEERDGLTSNIDAVLESANISQTQRDAVIADIEAIVEASGVTADDLQTIAEDVRAIRTEFQENHDRPGVRLGRIAEGLRGRRAFRP